MPVTELAYVSLKEGYTLSSPKVRSVLEAHKKSFTAFCTSRSYPVHVHYFSSLSDEPAETHFWIVAEWSTVKAHTEEYRAESAGEGVQEETMEVMDIKGVIDLDAAVEKLPVAEYDVVSFGRHVLTTEKKDEFIKVGVGLEELLNSAVKGAKKPAGAWKADSAAAGKEEFVLVCGWESEEEYKAFAKDGYSEEYRSKISGLVESFEIKHGKRFFV
jgi:hypothetical protein